MKLAYLKNVSFDPFEPKISEDPMYLFNDDNYKNYLEDKLEFHDFMDTTDLFKKLSELSKSKSLEIFNCAYDSKYVIQAFYYHTESKCYDQIIFVKREILENDSYTYLDFDKDNDKHIYVDVNIEDLIKILKNKYVTKGIKITSSNSFEVVEYVNISESGNIGTLFFSDGNTLKYANIKNIINEAHNTNDNNTSTDDNTEIKPDDVDEKINKLITETIDSNSVNHIYTQKNIDFCLLNYYSQVIGFEKNTMMSEILRDDIYGDIIVGIENSLDDDTRMLNVSINEFKKIHACIQSKIFKRKNMHYFNFYYEFS